MANIYKPQKWVDYDETLTEVENIERGAVPTAERMNNIENGVAQGLSQLNEQKQDKSPHSKAVILWTGGLLMNGSHIVRPDRPLSECETGWLLEWVRWNPVTNVQDELYPAYMHIFKSYKRHTISAMLPHVGTRREYSNKAIEYSNTEIKGYNMNTYSSQDKDTYRMVLRRVLSF